MRWLQFGMIRATSVYKSNLYRSAQEYTHEYRHDHPLDCFDHSPAGRSANLAAQPRMGLRSQRRHWTDPRDPAAALLLWRLKFLTPTVSRVTLRAGKNSLVQQAVAWFPTMPL